MLRGVRAFMLRIAAGMSVLVGAPMNRLLRRTAAQPPVAEPPAPTKVALVVSEIRDRLRERPLLSEQV